MTTGILQQEQKVSDAFSKQSVSFDSIYENNPITLWMRDRVRREVLSFLKPDDHILELNCGTGIDSVFFAQKGYSVFATDNAEGMLQKLAGKIELNALQDRITAQKCSFNDLSQLQGHQFNYIFSNFGGLNCTNGLAKVLKDMDQLLAPGGYFTFVIMPKACPWELLAALKGRFKTALRRFKRDGTVAHIEGAYFKCYYYNPAYVRKHVKVSYTLCSLRGLGSFVPPPFMDHFPGKYPKLFSMLEKIESRVCSIYPFNTWCDQYVITMQKAK